VIVRDIVITDGEEVQGWELQLLMGRRRAHTLRRE
jgi:hypothetical protein